MSTEIRSNCVRTFTLQLWCLGALIPAIIAIPTVDVIEERYNFFDEEYENGNGNKTAAGFLVALNSVAIAYIALLIILRCLYYHSVLVKYFKLYAVIVSDSIMSM